MSRTVARRLNDLYRRALGRTKDPEPEERMAAIRDGAYQKLHLVLAQDALDRILAGEKDDEHVVWYSDSDPKPVIRGGQTLIEVKYVALESDLMTPKATAVGVEYRPPESPSGDEGESALHEPPLAAWAPHLQTEAQEGEYHVPDEAQEAGYSLPIVTVAPAVFDAERDGNDPEAPFKIDLPGREPLIGEREWDDD